MVTTGRVAFYPSLLRGKILVTQKLFSNPHLAYQGVFPRLTPLLADVGSRLNLFLKRLEKLNGHMMKAALRGPMLITLLAPLMLMRSERSMGVV